MHHRTHQLGGLLVPVLLLATMACGKEPPAAGARARAVVVFAAASLREVVTEIAEGFTESSGIGTQLQFESSSTLARQIQEGAPCDVFVTASPEWLDGVPVKERFDWLGNSLVVVVRRGDAAFDLRDLESLAIGNEQVPAGKYARAALEHLRIALPERTIHGQNVRHVLSAVAEGGARAGIVYATDAAVEPSLRIAYTFPPESHPEIVYSVGLMTDAGQTFYAALGGPAALEVARRHGFRGVK